MANYANLKATINANIKANGTEAITGPVLNSVLTAAVNTLGAGYQFMGVAALNTQPGTPDTNVFYLATVPGTYQYFKNSSNVSLTVSDGEVAIFKVGSDGSWSKDTTGAATKAQLDQLGQEVNPIVSSVFDNIPSGTLFTSPMVLAAGTYKIKSNFSSVSVKENVSPYPTLARSIFDRVVSFTLSEEKTIVLQNDTSNTSGIFIELVYDGLFGDVLSENESIDIAEDKNDSRINVGEKSLDLLADYDINLLSLFKYTTGYYYQSSNGNKRASASTRVYEPIFVKGGVTLYYKNLYASLCGFRGSDNVWSAISSNASSYVSGTYTPASDGFLYVSIMNNSASNALLTTSNKLYQSASISEGATIKDGVKIPQVEALNTKINKIGVVHTNLLENETKIAGGYYNHWNGSIVSNADTSRYGAIPVVAGVKIYYKHLYAYFSGFNTADGQNWTALSDDSSNSVDGTFTPTLDGFLYISLNNTVSATPLLTTSKDMYDNDRYTEYVTYPGETGAPRIFYVGSTRDYTTLRAGIEEAVKYQNSIVYVDPETFDLTAEFSAEITAAGTTAYGILLKNGVHIIFSPGAIVNALYTGSNTNVVTYFNPFRTNGPGMGGGGFTLENLVIFAKNTRYCVHDEYSGADVRTRNRYINCEMHYDGTTSPLNYYQACIGGGAAKHSYVEIRNCYFDSEGTDTRPLLVSWHNANDAGAQSRIIMSNCYFKNGTFRLGYYGPSTLMSEAFINNCSFSVAPYKEAETPDSLVDNWEIIEFMNEVRS